MEVSVYQDLNKNILWWNTVSIRQCIQSVSVQSMIGVLLQIHKQVFEFLIHPHLSDPLNKQVFESGTLWKSFSQCWYDEGAKYEWRWKICCFLVGILNFVLYLYIQFPRVYEWNLKGYYSGFKRTATLLLWLPYFRHYSMTNHHELL